MDYFDNLAELLKLEQEEETALFQNLIETCSVYERRANGLSWYPVAIKDTTTGRGDYLSIETERTTHHHLPHQFRFGATVALFSNLDPLVDRITGVIAFLGGNRMKINLRVDELPEWARKGKLGIDLLPDNISYKEMQAALDKARAADNKNGKGRLVKILAGEQTPTFNEREALPVFPQLNASQQSAIKMILSANELAIIHGPPGTGKTTTLIAGIKAIAKEDKRKILVVAPSNTAVDLLSERLAGEGLKVLRVGNPARVSEKLMSLTIDEKMARHDQAKEIKIMKKRADEYLDIAHKYKRNFGRSEREQRKALFNEARKIREDIERTEQYILKDLIDQAQVITATLVGTVHYTVRDLEYSTVVIDEAGQALEPATWIPILKAEKVIMAGDHCQLPPTIKSQEALQKGLNITLMEKCVTRHPSAVVLLEEQYRMNEKIMGYSSGIFYSGKLKAHESVARHLLFEGDDALLYIDTAGCSFDERKEGTNISNPEEAAFLLKHLTGFLQEYHNHDPERPLPSVAVISPYRQQVEILQEYFGAMELPGHYLSAVTINTIDSFQGQEKDIVYISMVRSNTEGTIGFLSDTRRMNVAMTRARKKLVIIGDSATLSQSGFYNDFIAYVDQNGTYKSAWEYDII